MRVLVYAPLLRANSRLLLAFKRLECLNEEEEAKREICNTLFGSVQNSSVASIYGEGIHTVP